MQAIGEIYRKSTTVQLKDWRTCRVFNATQVYKDFIKRLSMAVFPNELILEAELKTIIGQIVLWYSNDERFKLDINKGLFLRDWLKVRKLKKCVNTETAFNAIKKEIDKTGLTANECILKAVEKSWGGFEAEWLTKTINNTSNNASNRRDLSQIDHGSAKRLADM